MQAPDQTNRTSGGLSYKWTVVIVVVFGVFMSVLDSTIVNIAIQWQGQKTRELVASEGCEPSLRSETPFVAELCKGEVEEDDHRGIGSVARRI